MNFPKYITGILRLLEFPWLSKLYSLGGKIISTSLSSEEQDDKHLSNAAQVCIDGFLIVWGAVGFSLGL